MNIKIALFQLNPKSNSEENFELVKSKATEAVDQGADIILLPELWNVGYASPEEYPLGKDIWEESAIVKGDDHFCMYQDLAKDLNIAIMLPYLEKEGISFMDSAVLFDRNGKTILNYRKVHTVDKGWEVMFKSGTDFSVAELDTKNGPVNIGCMICYDREFPEAARILMLEGAELILVPNACDIDRNRLNQFQARGFENMLGVAMTNYPSPKYNGRSVAYNGMRVKGENDYDPLVVLADDSEGIFYADFDIDALREYRGKEIWGDAYRKPRVYGKLIENDPKDPFVRPSARR